VLRSVLLDAARLEPGAEAVDSVVGPGAVLENDAIVSDRTLVGAAAAVSAGTRVAGARIQVPGAPAAR
jgi:NDP-sugar pyrophosphorylase family protein